MKASMIRRFREMHEYMVTNGREASAAAIEGILGALEVSTPEPKDFGIGVLFNEVNQAVIVVNAATERIVLWNDTATQIFGYSEDEAVGMELHTLVPPEFVERHRAGLRRFQETGEGEFLESREPLDLEALTQDGERISISLVLMPLLDPRGGEERHALGLILETLKAARVQD